MTVGLRIILVLLIILLFIIIVVLKKKDTESFQTHAVDEFTDLYQKNCDRFDPVNGRKSSIIKYCIYIPERESYIRNLFESNREDVIFFRGFEPDDLPDSVYKTFQTSEMAKMNPKTKLCVHLSYLMCIYHAILHETDIIVIYEDDIYFTRPYHETFADIYMEFSKYPSYDLCYLGFCFCEKCLDEQNTNIITLLKPNTSILCKHAIMYRLNYLKRIWKELLPLKQHSDIHFLAVHHKNDANQSIVSNPFVYQNRDKFKSKNFNSQSDSELKPFL